MVRILTRLYHRIFPLPTALEKAQEELGEAQLYALRDQTMAEYLAAQAECNRVMAAFNERRATRLSEYIAMHTDDKLKEM